MAAASIPGVRKSTTGLSARCCTFKGCCGGYHAQQYLDNDKVTSHRCASNPPSLNRVWDGLAVAQPASDDASPVKARPANTWATC
jgi:hypothetical protein